VGNYKCNEALGREKSSTLGMTLHWQNIKGLSERGEWGGEMEIGNNENGGRLLLYLDYKTMANGKIRLTIFLYGSNA
jgi:hypothetical protein